jgi:hypothetical protein
MPTSVKLVEVIASALEWPQTEVLHHARNLRNVGLVTKGGQGITAPQMSELDAANFMVAVLGSKRVKDSPEVVKGIAELRATSGGLRMSDDYRRWRPSIDLRHGLLGLQSGHTVQEGIAATFSFFQREEELRREWYRIARRGEFAIKMQLKIFYPRYEATLSIRIPDLLSESWIYSLPPAPGGKRIARDAGRTSQSRSCDERALRDVANALRG